MEHRPLFRSQTRPSPAIEDSGDTSAAPLPDTLRLLLVGPTLPFRGGIAQHTTLLGRALARHSELRLVSFQRLYPRWLRPSWEEKDPSLLTYREPGVEYALDALNPRNWRSVIDACIEVGPDALILPWWRVYWAPFTLYLGARMRRRGILVLFLCHNVLDHDPSWWTAPVVRQVLRGGDLFLVHTEHEAAVLRRLVPGSRVAVYPHPIQHHFPLPAEMRSRGDRFELLFFGFVRPYKGLDLLLEAMGRLRGRAIHLTIVGECRTDSQAIESRIRVLGIQSQVCLVPRYVSDEEAAGFFGRADAVVLPYVTATGSGVVPLAYHYGKPVIVTRVGGLAEWVVEGKTGYVVEPGSATGLADAIVRLSEDDLGRMGRHITAERKKMTWDGLAERVLQGIRDLSRIEGSSR